MSAPYSSLAPLDPGGTIGILGGGQLGRMLALAAAKVGLNVHIFCDDADAPAFAVSAGHMLAGFDDQAALAAFAGACDVVTLEFENVPAAALATLEALKPVFPGTRALSVTQDRLAEKDFVASLGLQTAPYAAVESDREARDAFARIGRPAILKTRRFGYDGKGQAKIDSVDAIRTALKTFAMPCILEGYVDFAFEASVIAARGRDGSFAAYDPPQNIHKDHILRRSVVPSPLTAAQSAEAKDMARAIGDALAYVGVFAVELFVGRDGRLLVNEIAPRVHNSGHWTLEACVVSQFEQHIRAVAGWPLGDPSRHSDAVMDNLIGHEAADWLRLAGTKGGLHLYGKKEIRSGRKMGHVTRLNPRQT